MDPQHVSDLEIASTGVRPRALVVQTGFIGDAVLATALFAPLEQAGYEVYALVTPASLPLMRNHPALAGAIADDKRDSRRGLRGMMETAAVLRRMGFGLALSPHRSHRTSLMLWVAGIPRRVGFASSPLPFLLTDRVGVEPGQHQLDRNRRLLRAAGISSQSPRMSLRMSLAAQEQAREMLTGLGRPLIGVAPGSAWATKRWPPEKYAATLRGLTTGHPGAGVVLLGGPQEREAAARIVSDCGGPLRDLAGRTSLEVLCAVIESLDLLICNDSAPVHMAGAYGIPTLVIFLATHPRFGYGPFTQPYRIAQASLPCRPCSPHGQASCPLGHFDCARKIDPVAVADLANELLDAPAREL
jgi:heptosyltransferase II